MINSDIISIIDKTKEYSPQERKSELIKYADKPSVSYVFLCLGNPDFDSRALLRALTDLCSYEKTRETIKHNAELHRSKLLALLKNDDAKTRKITAELIGKCDPKAYCAELKNALIAEKKDFVKPSLILALGNTKNNDALDFLKQYTITSETEKHSSEQKIAIKKAVSSLKGEQTAVLKHLPKSAVVVLNCPSSQVTLNELHELGFNAKEAHFPFNTVLVNDIRSFKSIYTARSFYSASILYGEYKTIKDAEKAISQPQFPLFTEKLFENEEIAFRIELKCEKGCEPDEDRTSVIERISRQIEKSDERLVVSPSSYICEIIINVTAKGVMVTVAPSRKLDRRFAYKKESIAASIHPAAAAACVQYIKRNLKDDAAVLDCFCGSGTMLFERAKLPYKTLTGSDISPSAIKSAKINEREAKTGAKFFAKNATDPFREQYDEVICNMPFGLRVGSHAKNRDLYKSFLDNLGSILKDSGFAFLFTNDKKLLTELIPNSFTLLSKHSFACGGLYPAMFILKKNG